MTSKYLVLKNLSSLIDKYTPKIGTLIQTLPDSDIFENPKTLTTKIYTINGVNVPIVKPLQQQDPPLSLKTLMDLKKYLKDSKSKEILDEYIKQQEIYESQQQIKQPLIAIEQAKQTIKATPKGNQKAIEEKPSATKGKEKALEDMDQYELTKFLKRDDISVSDKKKASKLLIKLQQTPKEKLAIEAAPKAKPKEAVKAEEKPLTEKETIKAIEKEILDETPIVQTDEEAKMRDEMEKEILDKIKEIYALKKTLPFKSEDEFLEYKKSFKKIKADWKKIGKNTSTITTPLNQLEKAFFEKLGKEQGKRK